MHPRCKIEKFSSRICEFGTKSCVTQHNRRTNAAPTAKGTALQRRKTDVSADRKIVMAYAALSDQDKEKPFADIAKQLSEITGLCETRIRKVVDDFIFNEVGDILKPGDLN